MSYLNTRNELAKQEQEDRQEREVQQRATAEVEARKDYIAKQKNSCLQIYQTETKQWNNIVGWDYNDYSDKCVITYRENVKKPRSACEAYLDETKEIYKDDVVPPDAFSFYLHCLEGTFTKEF